MHWQVAVPVLPERQPFCRNFIMGGKLMSLLDKLCDSRVWKQFYEYKTSLVGRSSFTKELEGFMQRQDHLPVYASIKNKDPFPLPEKHLINKSSSQKKRVVYVYPQRENTVLKLLTYLLLRKYDGLFSDCLYSFRPGRTAKDAVRSLTSRRDICSMYAYKADISNYFNSVPLRRLLPELEKTLSDDPELLEFLSGLLSEPRVLDKGRVINEEKGIMAGTPLASFYANLYLRKLDSYFQSKGIPYARYSDDIIALAPDKDTALEYAEYIRGVLSENGLQLNPDKEAFYSPEQGFTFLGFSFQKGTIDIAPITIKKIKAKMHRKARALQRWRKRSGLSGEKAAAAFIRIFNRKLLEGPLDNELTWSYWFFPVINTSKSLKEIDNYAQDCIRFLVSGVHRKSRFNVRYEDIKRLGYKNLVHNYYEFRKDNIEKNGTMS